MHGLLSGLLMISAILWVRYDDCRSWGHTLLLAILIVIFVLSLAWNNIPRETQDMLLAAFAVIGCCAALVLMLRLLLYRLGRRPPVLRILGKG